MSAVEFIRIAALVLIGGLIAWVGDVVGYRLGRKRVSLFGLRPRITAIAIGVFSGIIISLVTIGAMALADKQYRLALWGMDELQGEIGHLRAGRAALREQVAAVRAEADTAATEAEAARQRGNELEGKIADSETHLKSLRGQLAQRQARLKSVQGELKASQGRSEALQQAARGLEQEIAELERGIEGAERESASLQGELKKVREEYEKTRTRLLGEFENPAIVDANEELARGVVDLNQPSAAVRDELMALLEQASDEAEAAGAALGANGRAVRLYALREATDVPTLEPEVPEPQVIDAVLDVLLAQEHKSEVLSVTAKFPALAGEQVKVGFRGGWNKLCFAEGEVVASEIIDGSKPRADLYMDLTVLLTGPVRAEALERGMLYLPNSKEVGHMPVHELFDAIEALKDRGRPTEVAAVVERDTWSIGPLNIDLRVGPDE